MPCGLKATSNRFGVGAWGLCIELDTENGPELGNVSTRCRTQVLHRTAAQKHSMTSQDQGSGLCTSTHKGVHPLCASTAAVPKVRAKLRFNAHPMLSHNPTMAVTSGIPRAGNHCSQVQQTRRSRAHESSKCGRAAATSPARRRSRHHVCGHISCHCVPPSGLGSERL